MQSMYQRLLLCAAIAVLAAAPAGAHIKNEASQFPDIEFSDARFDIVMLVGAGIIPQTPVFEPDKLLSMSELAAWVALARGLGQGGETPDVGALAEAVVSAGLIESLDGNARYADINTLMFDGQIAVGTPDSTLTKAEAAGLIATYIGTPEGDDLLRARDLALGETGEVTSVDAPQGGRGYEITIGDVTRPMDAHGRVANGPTDLYQWEGRYVVRSFVSGSGDGATWTYLEAGQPPAPEVTEDATAAMQETTETAAGDNAGPAATAMSDDETVSDSGDRSLLTYLFIAVVVLGALLFVQRRRKG